MVQGCSLFVKNEREEPVARVLEHHLYPSDLAKVIPPGKNSQDSVLWAARYIETWVKDQLMKRRAEESLTEEQMDFEAQIQEYHRSLLIYTYRQNLLQQKMDTVVSEGEINSYYEENSKNFVLTQNVIKGTFIKVPHSAPNQDSCDAGPGTTGSRILIRWKNTASAMQRSIMISMIHGSILLPSGNSYPGGFPIP